jgi:hypothetical protein
MAELRVPAGTFLLVELHSDLSKHLTTSTGVWASLGQVAGIKSISDLSTMPIALFEEQVLMRLSPQEERLVQQALRRRK